MESCLLPCYAWILMAAITLRGKKAPTTTKNICKVPEYIDRKVDFGKFVDSQLEFFCLQLSFFAYSLLRPLFLDALSHCKWKSFSCKQEFPTWSTETPIVSKKLPSTIASKKLSCKQQASNCKQKTLHPRTYARFQNIASKVNLSEPRLLVCKLF